MISPRGFDNIACMAKNGSIIISLGLVKCIISVMVIHTYVIMCF